MNCIWNEKINLKKRINMEIIGVFIFLIAVLLFIKLYDKGVSGQYLYMMLCTVGVALGVELMVLPLNFANKYILYFALIICGALLATCYFSNYARVFFVLFILVIAITGIVCIMRKVFSAFLLFTILSMVVIMS
ncbi:MAG: hypothetical protein PUF12_10480 [Thermoflexaceae bacterium]|nr:hypothetical protein [Thermoflexaceae bacterium]